MGSGDPPRFAAYYRAAHAVPPSRTLRERSRGPGTRSPCPSAVRLLPRRAASAAATTGTVTTGPTVVTSDNKADQRPAEPGGDRDGIPLPWSQEGAGAAPLPHRFLPRPGTSTGAR
ncbi:hypothetical protein GCM10009629_41880 [Pseudonocardia alni]